MIKGRPRPKTFFVLTLLTLLSVGTHLAGCQAAETTELPMFELRLEGIQPPILLEVVETHRGENWSDIEWRTNAHRWDLDLESAFCSTTLLAMHRGFLEWELSEPVEAPKVGRLRQLWSSLRGHSVEKRSIKRLETDRTEEIIASERPEEEIPYLEFCGDPRLMTLFVRSERGVDLDPREFARIDFGGRWLVRPSTATEHNRQERSSQDTGNVEDLVTLDFSEKPRSEKALRIVADRPVQEMVTLLRIDESEKSAFNFRFDRLFAQVTIDCGEFDGSIVVKSHAVAGETADRFQASPETKGGQTETCQDGWQTIELPIPGESGIDFDGLQIDLQLDGSGTIWTRTVLLLADPPASKPAAS